MTRTDEELLRRMLEEAGIADSDRIGMSWWLDQEESTGMPALPTALLLRQAWRAILEPTTTAVADVLKDLKRRAYDDDSFQSATLRRNPAIANKLTEALQDPELGPAMVYLLRSVQVETVGAILQLIGGAEVYEAGLRASWGLYAVDEDLNPQAFFGNLVELFYEFDPVANKPGQVG